MSDRRGAPSERRGRWNAWIRAHGAVIALLLIVAALLAAWSIVVPAWETNDEPDHWAYAVHVHDTGEIPPYNTTYIEGNEAPLYYYLISPFVTNGLRVQNDVAPGPDGHSVYPDAPRLFVPSQSDLTEFADLHVVRLISALISLGAVLFTYLAALELTKRSATAVLAAAFVGLLPEFIFRGMSVGPDGAATTACALATWLAVRVVTRGFTWRRGVGVGIAIAVATLTKANAAFIGPGLAILVVAARPAPSGGARIDIKRLAAFIPGILLIAPWLIRNQLTYGDPLAAGAMRAAVPSLISPHPLFSSYFVNTFPSVIATTFIGDFGFDSVHLPTAVVDIYLVAMVIAVGGAVLAFRSGTANRLVIGSFAVVGLGVLLAVVAFNLNLAQPQGRYLFPALPALAIAGAVGLGHLPPYSRWANRSVAVTVATLAALALLILSTVVAPAYAATA